MHQRELTDLPRFLLAPVTSTSGKLEGYTVPWSGPKEVTTCLDLTLERPKMKPEATWESQARRYTDGASGAPPSNQAQAEGEEQRNRKGGGDRPTLTEARPRERLLKEEANAPPEYGRVWPSTCPGWL